MKFGFGVDLGGTTVKLAYFDEVGTMLDKWEIPTDTSENGKNILPDIAKAVLKYMEEKDISKDDILGVGIGVPGAVNNKGIVAGCDNLGWGHFSVKDALEPLLGMKVVAGNDATVAALGECWKGGGQGYKSMVLVTLGTGVGGGIIIDGKPWNGVHGVASELGHMIICVDGEMCTCGNKGCWERYASATAIIRMGKKAAEENPGCEIARSVDGNLDAITAKTVIDAAKAGDEVAVKVFDNYVYHLCAGLVNIINFMDPEVIVLGGGVSAAGEFLLKPIREKLAKMVFYKAMPYANVELATLGNDAGIIGAAMLGL